MADYNPMMETRGPAVQCADHAGPASRSATGFLGHWKKKVFRSRLRKSSPAEAVALAKEAAHMSPLNVGIGVDGAKGTLALHHRDLPADHPLFVFKLREVGSRRIATGWESMLPAW